MKNEKILLSIGIPTYNRAGCLKTQLFFLYEELNDLSEEERSMISITVRDNCSSDNTREVVMSSPLFTSKSVKSEYVINEHNLGLSGNLQKLYSTLEGDYMWIIGDDDALTKGIVGRVFNECNKKLFDYIFINHTVIKNDSVVRDSVLSDVDPTRMDKTALWDLYKKSGTVMMLISACIYKSSHVKDYLARYEVDLVIPCSLSFYCASKGNTKYIKDSLLVNDQTDISWSKSLSIVFYHLIPSMLLRMGSWGYNRTECYHEYVKIKKKSVIRFVKNIARKILK